MVVQLKWHGAAPTIANMQRNDEKTDIRPSEPRSPLETELLAAIQFNQKIMSLQGETADYAGEEDCKVQDGYEEMMRGLYEDDGGERHPYFGSGQHPWAA